MRTFSRPKIIVSACLEQKPCRYDGSMISSSFIKRIHDYVEIIPVCPEVSIGLSIPREAIRLIRVGQNKHLLGFMSGEDHTLPMLNYTNNFIQSDVMQNIHGGVLKSRSPSCGIKAVKIYAGTGKVPCLEEKSTGFFGGAIIEHDPDLPLEDEGRLLNYDIREHFLTRIFTLSAFDKIKEDHSLKSLIKFHSDNKYLLMASHQALQKSMGKLVANHEHLNIEEILVLYEKDLKRALSRAMQPGRTTNMILHIFGYFSKDLSADEKAYFLDQLSQYNLKKLPLSAVRSLLYAWVIRFNHPYLKEQTIFEPYTRAILDVMDSGKGIQ